MPSISAGERFRDRLKRGILPLPGIYNAITAKLAQDAGFDAAYVSGAGVTNALTGFPDIGLLTLTEMSQQVRYICRAVDLPVIADADTGYGDVMNVARTVEEFEQAGLAGLHLEDQVSPKRCGHLDGKQLVSCEEMVRKIVAARGARSDSAFFLIARTDARGVSGFDDAVDRAKRYLDAGADAVFPESLQSVGEFERFARECDVPLMANMTEFGKTPIIPLGQFEAMGYAMVIFPMSAFRAMMYAGRELYRMLRESGSQAAMLDRMQTRQELYDLIGYSEFTSRDRRIAGATEDA